MKNFPRKPAVNGTPASEIIPINMAKARNGERFAEASVIVDLLAGSVSDNDENGKTKQGHEQIGDEIIGDRGPGKTRRHRSSR